MNYSISKIIPYVRRYVLLGIYDVDEARFADDIGGAAGALGGQKFRRGQSGGIRQSQHLFYLCRGARDGDRAEGHHAAVLRGIV